VGEAEDLIRRVLVELDSPAMSGSTCTASLLLEKTKSCLDTIDNSTAKFSLYNNDPSCRWTKTTAIAAACVVHMHIISSQLPSVLSFSFFIFPLCPAISEALCSLPSLSHTVGEVILQGAATSNMASAEDGKSEC